MISSEAHGTASIKQSKLNYLQTEKLIYLNLNWRLA